ncbi:type II pantothenate kinase [Lentibacillus salicampi]|uniref:Type II pantothenate kinase n=1 Tax=Lentibacillus salicampi TaxID=175306 RepID=A0A4Y9A9F2_9BACI|nr:type II pantothenate kinase [Lentibacillus salicampi]TFJ92443.1 type II pantothenate kinase [Lentibacillus salicampi]
MKPTKIGIDAGGTLIKISYLEEETIRYRSFQTQHIGEAASWVNDHFRNPKICLTGGKSQVFAEELDVSTHSVLEFEATTRGITYLADEDGHSLGSHFLFVNIGTGTSMHYVKNGTQERVGGSGIGGGTLMGLAYLTTGMTDYDEIVRLAGIGNRGNVDLKVKDIFEGAVPPISGDLTASNLGKTAFMMQNPPTQQDTLASIIGLIGEVIVTISSQMAAHYNADSIVYVGSSFRDNPIIREIIETYAWMIGKKPVFLQHGDYSGAVGALLAVDEGVIE